MRPSLLRKAVLSFALSFSSATASSPALASNQDASEQQLLPSAFCRGLFVVPVTWNDATLHYVLDTGASRWSTDPDALERIKGRRYSPGKKVTLRKGEAGPLKLRKVRTLVHEMDHLALALGHEVDGIMGFDTFDELLLTLDYPAREIRVGNGALPEVDGATIFRDYGKHRPYLRFEIGDSAVALLVDSGFSEGLKLHQDDPLKWRVEPTMVHVAVRYSEVELQFAGRLDAELRLGPLTLVEPIAGITDGTRLVGAGFLQHLQLTFNPAEKRIRMIASGNTRIESEPYRSLGLGLRPRRNGMEVTGVFDDTPADLAGIVKGDLLTHIDGEYVHDRQCTDIQDRPPEKRRLTMVRNGNAYEVEVQRAVLVP